jgi:hypothetical protein
MSFANLCLALSQSFPTQTLVNMAAARGMNAMCSQARELTSKCHMILCAPPLLPFIDAPFELPVADDTLQTTVTG